MASRITEMFSKIPIVTLSLLLFNSAVHALIFLLSLDLGSYSISAAQVLKGEYYRVISATYIHGGIMHIFMNMSSLLQLGASLEAQFGSMQFAFLTLWSTILIGMVYVFLSWVAAEITMDKNQLRSSAVGFSGVLFCYAVIEANHTTETTRSMYGLFNVPAKLFPFILLVVLQIIIPNVSWLGHLSGLIIGLISISDAMHLCLTSDALIQYVEEKVTPFSIVYRLSSYVRCTNKSMIISSSSGICSTVYAGIQLIFTHIWNVIAVVLHIVGFPTDRCCAAVRSCFSPIYSFITSCCSSREQSLQAMPISTFSFANRDSGSVIASEGRTRLGGTGTKSNLAGTESSAIGSERYAAINQEV